jgi:outer membrane lipoprotein carrier protein
MLSFLFVTVLLFPQAAGAAPSPDDLARNLQRKYEQIQSFTADFEHVYEGGVLRKKVAERGNVMIRKPGLMRWTYTAPEKKEFVSDGRKLYSYIPEDRQVIVTAVPTADEASSPALFLAGKGNIGRDFTASAATVPGLRRDEYALKLVPRNPQQEYDWLVLVVARDTLQIRRLVTTDAQGGTSTFVFSHFRENVKLPDGAFTFRIPRGVEVIDGSRSR